MKDKIVEFDVEHAEKLVASIDALADIRNLRVPNPESRNMETIPLKDWIKWLFKRCETYGTTGTEQHFISIIHIIDNNSQVVVERAKESLRRMLAVQERMEILADEKEKEIENLKDEIKRLNNIINPPPSEPVVQPPTQNNGDTPPQPKRKRRWEDDKFGEGSEKSTP